jgi:hypothetical protein
MRKISGNMGLAMKLDKIPRKSPSAPASPAPTSSASGSKLKSAAVFDVRTKDLTVI